MATRKMNIKIWGIVGLLVMTAWILGSVTEARADTMKCRTAGVMIKREVVPIPDVEGHILTLNARDGLAFCEPGDVATFQAYSTSDLTLGKGGSLEGLVLGYHIYTFVDGSSIIASFRQTMEQGPAGGKFASYSKHTGEIIKGTGRFAGIKGSLSGDGRQFKPDKGELSGKSTNNYIFTYTLPSK